MAKVAILVPYLEMRDMAEQLVAEYPRLNPMCVEYVRSSQVVARAKELEQAGCELIIARGLHANMIKQAIRLPVVEICVTAQELGEVLLSLKNELCLPLPRIALIGFDNMLCDTSKFNSLFGIDLRRYMVERSSDLAYAVEQAVNSDCNAVVGGDVVVQQAVQAGIARRFIPAGEESMRDALEAASGVSYAIEKEKQNVAELDAMLNHTFSGIMQVDMDGIVQRANRSVFNLLEKLSSDVIGNHVTDLIPQVSANILTSALHDGKETYAFTVDIHHKAVIINVAPVLVEGRIIGAVLTLQEGARVIEMDNELRRELYRRGYIARFTFDNIVCASKEAQTTAALARRIAKYNAPVLITGEAGTGKAAMAQCIHNDSLFRNNAFLSIDCSAWLPETLDNMLFGNYTTRKDSDACMAELAQDGTLYLSHVEKLPIETQYKLLNLIRGKFLHNGSNRPINMNVRVLASTPVNLTTCVEQGTFRNDLYYALSVLTLELSPLRRHPEDILGWADYYLNEWQEKYKRYIHLTQGARQYMQDYDWPGNLNQMNNICERLVLLTEKRNIDEVFLRKQLEQISPTILPGTEKIIMYKDQKAVRITELLRKHGGNREKVAAELGVSKTTLWRYIKKYGIEPDYSY